MQTKGGVKGLQADPFPFRPQSIRKYKMAHPAGLASVTLGLDAWHAVHLSYGHHLELDSLSRQHPLVNRISWISTTPIGK